MYLQEDFPDLDELEEMDSKPAQEEDHEKDKKSDKKLTGKQKRKQKNQVNTEYCILLQLYYFIQLCGL